MKDNKISEIQIDALVDVSKNPVDLQTFTDMFVEFIEKNNWLCFSYIRPAIDGEKQKEGENGDGDI